MPLADQAGAARTSAARTAVGTLAVAIATLLLNSARMPHPPAASGTLIVAPELTRSPVRLAVVSAAVLLMARTR